MQQARARAEVREESTKGRGEHDRDRGCGSGVVCRSREVVLRNPRLQYVSYSALPRSLKAQGCWLFFRNSVIRY